MVARAQHIVVCVVVHVEDVRLNDIYSWAGARQSVWVGGRYRGWVRGWCRFSIHNVVR